MIIYRLRDPKIVLPTVIAGLQTYFDRALGANLLYRFERPQFAEIRRQYVTGQTVVVGQEKDMSAVYGAEHLLRMLGTFRTGLQPSIRPIDLPLCHSKYAGDGGNLHNGSGECGYSARLRKRAYVVSTV